jgi:hypothetical protein
MNNQILFIRQVKNFEKLRYKYPFKILILSVLALSIGYFFSLNNTLYNHPLLPITLVLTFFGLIFYAFEEGRDNIHFLELTTKEVNMKYYNFGTENSLSWNLKDTNIELVSLKTSKDFFDGAEIFITNEAFKKTLKLKDTLWAYTDMEIFYLEFKKEKQEKISEIEQKVLNQLQIMNGTVGKLKTH